MYDTIMDSFFKIYFRGKYKAYVKMDGEAQPKMVGEYDNSGSFGELALMYK
jgi:hypothetical protein